VELLERQGPFTRLDTALEEARSGNGRVVVVCGEAGIGKTALVRTSSRTGLPTP
jgi:predicted ATPase